MSPLLPRCAPNCGRSAKIPINGSENSSLPHNKKSWMPKKQRWTSTVPLREPLSLYPDAIEDLQGIPIIMKLYRPWVLWFLILQPADV